MMVKVETEIGISNAHVIDRGFPGASGLVTKLSSPSSYWLSCYQPRSTYATREPGVGFRCQTVMLSQGQDQCRPQKTGGTKRGLLFEAVAVILVRMSWRRQLPAL